ncbi:hypothetical protein MRX96_002117 [Rhipicephalus microplus]
MRAVKKLLVEASGRRGSNSRRFLGEDLACLAEALLRSTATSADRRLPADVRPEGGGGGGAGSGGVASAQQYVYERPKARRKNFSIAVSKERHYAECTHATHTMPRVRATTMRLGLPSRGACMQTCPDRPETRQRARNVALLTLELHGTFIQRAGVDHGTAATRKKGVAVPNLGEENTQHSRSMLEERRCHGGWQYGHVLEAPPLTTTKTPHSSTGGRPWSHWHAPERRSAESADTGKERACFFSLSAAAAVCRRRGERDVKRGRVESATPAQQAETIICARWKGTNTVASDKAIFDRPPHKCFAQANDDLAAAETARSSREQRRAVFGAQPSSTTKWQHEVQSDSPQWGER